jgi:DNA-binding response OmpR family regulator
MVASKFGSRRLGMRVLLVEDKAELAELVSANLRRSGFAVDVARLLEEAEAALAAASYDIVLLDLRLPDGDGFNLIRQMRRSRDSTPIIVLTARDRLSDRVEGLNLGADDYLVKPFAHEELLARVLAVLRRPKVTSEPEISLGNLTLALESGEVAVGSERVEVPRRELTVLRLLMRRAGRVVSRETLENGMYDDSREIESNALEAAISRLRKRLSGAGADVEVVGLRGAGYLLRAKTP